MRVRYSEISLAIVMKIHEYQAKALLSRHSVPVPRGEVATTADEAEGAARKLGGSVVVKAQIHAGGRGKGTIQQVPTQRGVQLVRSAGPVAVVFSKRLSVVSWPSRL